MRKLVNPDHLFRIKKFCPYCRADLLVRAEGWERRQDGTWAADTINMDCDAMPEDFTSTEWREHFDTHSFLPYEYWLPAEQAIVRKLNEKYNFDLG